MKIIFLTITIYAFAYVVLGASTTKHERTMQDAIEEKCFENSQSKNAFVNLNDGIDNYKQCNARTLNLKTPPHLVEQHDEFCRYIKESGHYSCLQNLARNVSPCLDTTEKFFPNMILKAYNTTLDILCGTTGLLNTEYIFNTMQKNHECLYKTYQMIVNTGKCVKRLIAYKNFNQQIVNLNHHDYCIDMKSFVNCATKVAERKCHENFSIIKSHISDLFLSECKHKIPLYWLVRT